MDNLGAVIKDFTYGIAAPWPDLPNGAGPCLVLIKPETNPAHGTATNWRASTVNGGNPGVNDGLRFNTFASANGITDLTGRGDIDGDGNLDLMEYALGLNSALWNSDGLSYGTQAVTGSDYMTITFTRPIGRDDVTYQAEASTGLLTAWENAVLVSSVNNGNGTETLVYRHTRSKSLLDPQQFLRLKVIK